VNSTWDQYDENPVAPGYGALDDVAVIRRPWDDGDAPDERVELGDTLLAAHPDDLVPAVERLLDQVPTELSGRTNDAHPHPVPPHVRQVPGGRDRL